MPIYEYECEKCGKTMEVMQKFSDSPLTTCDCSGHLHKLISRSSFHLKGSGWYVTDYAGKKSATGSGNDNSKAENKTESKSESKSESKTDSGSKAQSSTKE
jgi:putative FmdB family regulatory protein